MIDILAGDAARRLPSWMLNNYIATMSKTASGTAGGPELITSAADCTVEYMYRWCHRPMHLHRRAATRNLRTL